jgi:hypothetical protein
MAHSCTAHPRALGPSWASSRKDSCPPRMHGGPNNQQLFTMIWRSHVFLGQTKPPTRTLGTLATILFLLPFLSPLHRTEMRTSVVDERAQRWPGEIAERVKAKMWRRHCKYPHRCAHPHVGGHATTKWLLSRALHRVPTLVRWRSTVAQQDRAHTDGS